MPHRKFYLTTPLYYVNSKPHLGTLYSTLIADMTARWRRMSGRDVLFLTGTDEYGQKIASKARDEGVSPMSFVDAMVPQYKDMWRRYEVTNDKFIRTTSEEHKRGVLHLLDKLKETGDIYKSTYTGLYCVPCETFVTAKEEVCPTCARELVSLEEENYFFRLSGYQDKLLEFYEKHPDFIAPRGRINEVISFVKGGLQDLSISRSGLEWGIRFPDDPDHAVYVWVDALTNYISAIGYGGTSSEDRDCFAHWWPADLQIMAKDIVRFHAVYFLALLMAAELPLPKKFLVHGYIMLGKDKMSKSLGNVVDPAVLAKTYGVEQVRYYLLRHMSTHQDGSFTLENLEKHITSDLANSLGNLLSRVVLLALKHDLAYVPAPGELEPDGVALHERCTESYRSYSDYMHHYDYHLALSELWKYIGEVNAYFNDQEPWKVAKENKELFAEIISVACHSLRVIALMATPAMPTKMAQLLATIGKTFDENLNYEDILRKNEWNETFRLTTPTEPLFARHETKEKPMQQEETKEQTIKEAVPASKHISIDDFIKVEMHVGEIVEAKEVEGSSKLLHFTVDLGLLGKRSILSGVKKSFSPDELLGKKGIYVTNLPPRRMMGLPSEGMMLYAKDDAGNMTFVTVASEVANGTRLS